MADAEAPIDSAALANELRLTAQEPHGLRLQLNPDEELRLVLSGRGELVLFVGLRAQEESGPTPSPAPEGTPRTEADTRVKLRGRVGTELQFRPLPHRGLRVGFRFAAFSDREKPDWRDVYATGRFAEAIREKGIVKGDEIEVTGERQQAVQKQRDGTERAVERIFAYSVAIKKRSERPK